VPEWSGAQDEVISQIASFDRPNPAQGQMAHAVAPAAMAPTLRDRPRPVTATAALHASTVAFAPAAMTALMEAQEHLADNAPVMVRRRTAQEIDKLIYRMNDGAASADAPLAVRQLKSARLALSHSLVDLQA
jgi:hypothetical protein